MLVAEVTRLLAYLKAQPVPATRRTTVILSSTDAMLKCRSEASVRRGNKAQLSSIHSASPPITF